jgi:hypothetical protein
MCFTPANNEEHLQHLVGCIELLKLHSPHFTTLLIWMNDPPPDFLQNGHQTIIALLSKGFRATSPLRFALTRQKDVSSFDFFPELLVIHNISEWWRSVDCVILSQQCTFCRFY